MSSTKIAQLGKRSKGAILTVQTAYFTGLRLGEMAGLTLQDINFEEPCNAPADILKKAGKQQLKNHMQYGGLYHRNFYKAYKPEF